MVPAPTKKNIVTIGASSGVMGFALRWQQETEALRTHRLIMVDEKSHYNFVFAFPRACVKTGFERELFVPYDNMFDGDDQVGKVVHARVIAIHEHHIELDRSVPEFGTRIDFEYLIYAAGTTIPPPGRFENANTKAEGIAMLKKYQQVIRESKRPVIIGGGAVGLELASEIKEHYPEKEVTLIHSRSRYMARYMESFDRMTYNVLKKHGVKQILGDRVVLPERGFPLKVEPLQIRTKNGKLIEGDLAIMCIGMTPNSKLLADFSPQTVDKQSRFVKVKDTLQIQDDRYPNIYAVGDVIDHTDVKTGHFAWMQGLAVLNNIVRSIKGEALEPYKSKDVALIKLILGDKDAVMQTNLLGPVVALGSWVSGRSIPYNVHAHASWEWLKTPLDNEHADL